MNALFLDICILKRPSLSSAGDTVTGIEVRTDDICRSKGNRQGDAGGSLGYPLLDKGTGLK